MSVSDPLDRMLAERQADRLPSVAAAVVRDGRIAWSGAVGTADYASQTPATPDTQYRIGSITKTFTATAIMQLRAEAKLGLDDRLDQYLEGVASGSPTIRRLLCHLSGLQREVGDMFVTGASPTEEELTSHLELVLEPGEQHHYSNLAYALLGRVVARVSRERYIEYVDRRIIRPLGLERTSWLPQPPKAEGYLVDDYAGTVWTEHETDLAGAVAAGQLWSTVEDLARWAAFLAAGHEGVLDERTIEEMWFPQVMYYPDDWTLGWGLGLMLVNRDGVIYGGHGGAMAGHLAGVFVDRKARIGGAALTNSGTRGDMETFAVDLAQKATELWPPAVEPWQPEPEPPAEVRALLGRWWSEGSEFVFTWRDGALQAKVAWSMPGKKETTFVRDGEGWRAARGRERGERLRVDGDRLIWAGYAFTRGPEPFIA